MKSIISSRFVAVCLSAVALSLATPSFAGQPHMQEALEHLRAAKAQLERAEHNKGGHREEAIELINRAIAQVEKGIADAR